jgi:DNA polymerase III subunit chi
MTRIDFYVLQAQGKDERLQFTARLVDKAWQQGCKVLIRTANAAMAEELDTLLWHIKPESFIPHSREPAAEDPVVICLNSTNPPHGELLINLADSVPEDFGHFQRLAEIVVQIPDVLAATRLLFGHYREQGYTVNTHKL